MGSVEGVRMIMGGAEIDTRAPFKSVKEAVMLFGERVLVGEIYANKLKEMQDSAIENGSGKSKAEEMAAELEVTKQSLEEAREEANTLTQCIKSLKKELEQTKNDLEDTKARELKLLQKRQDDPETEDTKFIANSTTNVEIKTQNDNDNDNDNDDQKTRFVKFASPHVLAQVIPNKEDFLGRPPSIKKVKKKPLMHLMGWLFTKKRIDSPKA